MNNIDKLERTKRELAASLNKLFQRLPDKAKKRSLVLICLLIAAISMYVAIHPFVTSHHYAPIDKGGITAAVIPPTQNLTLSEQDRELMLAFLHTIDSLKKYDRQTYDKAMQGHEHLVDSILFLLYHSGQSLLQK